MSLRAEIARWDGRSSADIEQVYQVHSNEPDFVDQLLATLSMQELQNGASWLLKAGLENQGELDSAQCKNFFQCLPLLEHWSARLHALQCIPFLTIPDASEMLLEHFLRANLLEANKFVRAWTYNGFAELSRKNSKYREEVLRVFELAHRDEAASVKARIRRIENDGF